MVGFDGTPVFAYVTPPLTTVRQPFDGAAREGEVDEEHGQESSCQSTRNERE